MFWPKKPIKLAREQISPDLSLERDRIDIRPDKGMVKFIYVEGYGEFNSIVAAENYYTSKGDALIFIENTHDGVFFDKLLKTSNEQ
jgi:hypothetical protein